MKKMKLALCITCVGILLMAYCIYTIEQVPGLLQYIVQADVETDTGGAEKPPTQLKQRLESYEALLPELREIAEACTLTGTAAQVSVADDDAEGSTQATAGLMAVGPNHFVVHPALPLVGRLLHEEEMAAGERVALIDEQLAIDLFKMADVVDRDIYLQGQAYRVVGVLRHQKHVEDQADQYVYIPMETVAKDTKLPVQMLRVSAVPVRNGGAMDVFQNSIQKLKPGGTLYDLRQERAGATIWARFLGCGVGFALLGMLITKFVQSIVNLHQQMKRRLENQYASRLLPYLIGHVLVRLVALVALTAIAAGIMTLLLEPIQAYPQYVPEIVVEPESILKTFWDLRRAESTPIVLRTPQVVRLIYFGGMCNIATILTLAGGCLLFWRRGKRV